ncbi:cryptochrome/photolyase family protein [Microbacterium sp. DT81.1]|uniref:cryptochrome/photolyase family protein n=1 Tax=Microbacterium sp. DT81.1 TaxID=3393413 RepID=UPI003CE76AA4
MSAPSLVWLRDDLRIADNPALSTAAERGPVVVLYVLDEASPGIRPLGGASRWWLHGSLEALGGELAGRGVALVLRRGEAGAIVPEVAAAIGAKAVFWNRRYGGAEREVDTAVKAELRERGLDVASFAASLLFEPWTVQTGSGTSFSVFTPFWNACRALPEPRHPLPEPELTGAPAVPGDALENWELRPARPDWAGGLRELWIPGERGGREQLRAFLTDDLGDYAAGRDTLADRVTSRLSPHLRWGEVSPYQAWHAVAASGADGDSVSRFLSELGWREFAAHVLYHFPDLATRNWRRQFDAFPWRPADETALRAWQQGRTGIPVVDAGMHELWTTGTMHNRVRMITASFLTKNLLLDWRLGEQWFWDTLVDADGASNPFNWQWVAGSGADAAPYFRIFNPEVQAKKFDPDGAYVKRWAPEHLSGEAPDPIVDLAASRKAALAAYEVVRRAGA